MEEIINDLILQLGIDSEEVLAEDYNVNSFLDTVDEALECREYKTLMMA